MGDWTEKEFARKVDWEGGVAEALQWGLTSDMLKNQDSELAKAWAAVELARPALEAAEQLVSEILEEEDEEDE